MGEDAIYCEGLCNGWLHRKCAGMSNKCFARLADSNNKFLCVYCMLFEQTTLVKDLSEEINSLKTKLAPESTIAGNTNNLQNMDTSNVVDGSNPTANAACTGNGQTIANTDKQILTVVTNYINEEKEKSKRRLNVIMHNIPESTSEDGNTRRKHDTDFVTDMCQKHLNTAVSITKCFRLGKKGSKPRLLKISLSTEIEKAKLLRNCTKLRDPNLPLVMRKIFITPDLTPNEQRFNNS